MLVLVRALGLWSLFPLALAFLHLPCGGEVVLSPGYRIRVDGGRWPGGAGMWSNLLGVLCYVRTAEGVSRRRNRHGGAWVGTGFTRTYNPRPVCGVGTSFTWSLPPALTFGLRHGSRHAWTFVAFAHGGRMRGVRAGRRSVVGFR